MSLAKAYLWCTRHFVALLFLLILFPLGLFVSARYDRHNTVLALLWAAAMIVLGFFFGLLFALPRYSRTENRPSGSTQDRGLDVNTNLLDIADWLTKIIVGLGLYELKGIPKALRQFAGYVAQGFTANGSEQFSMAMILHFVLLGFVAGYLLTRLELNRLIRAADVIYTRPFAEPIESLSSGELKDPTERPTNNT